MKGRQTHKQPKDKDRNSASNREDWWLREYGHFPTRDDLIAIREHERSYNAQNQFRW